MLSLAVSLTLAATKLADSVPVDVCLVRIDVVGLVFCGTESQMYITDSNKNLELFLSLISNDNQI